MKVVLANKSKTVLEYLRPRLLELGNVSIVCQTTDKVLARLAIERFNPTIAILDVHTSGGASLEELLKIKRLSTAPIVILTTQDSHSYYKSTYLNSGADYCFRLDQDISKLIKLLSEINHVHMAS